MVESTRTIAPQPRARVRGMKEYHPPLGSRELLRLDFNENTLACSPKVREVLGSISAGELTRYPEREPVETIVAAYLGLSARQVALTNGVDEAIHVVFEAFLEAGDELLLPVPTYTMYEVYASATDARIVTVQAADDLQFPFDRLLAAITPKTKIIAIANPNSPSGSAATRAQLLEIARRAPHAVLLVDEAYFHFHGETVIDQIDGFPNLFVTRTFSKAYGLAGLRIGVLAGPVELMRWVRRVLSPYSVNSLALACLPSALEDTAYIEWYVGEVLAAIDDANGRLLPDTHVTVTATTSSEQNALIIPREALHSENGKPYVFRVESGSLVRTAITIGTPNLTSVPITSGLKDGDVVATGSLNGLPLEEGVPVKVVR